VRLKKTGVEWKAARSTWINKSPAHVSGGAELQALTLLPSLKFKELLSFAAICAPLGELRRQLLVLRLGFLS
jgi:hypothetical protein